MANVKRPANLTGTRLREIALWREERLGKESFSATKFVGELLEEIILLKEQKTRLEEDIHERAHHGIAAPKGKCSFCDKEFHSLLEEDAVSYVPLV